MKMLFSCFSQRITPLILLTTAGIVMGSCRKNTMLLNAESPKSAINITTITASIQDKNGLQVSEVGIPVMLYKASLSIPFITNNPETEGILVVPELNFLSEKTHQTVISQDSSCAVRASFKTKAGDPIQGVAFKLMKGTYIQTTFAPNSIIAMTVQTESGMKVTKVFTTKDANTTISLGVFDLTGAQSIVSGVVSMQSIPLENAIVKLNWPNGSSQVETNTLGVYEASVPTHQTITLTIAYDGFTQTHQLETGTSDFHSMGVTDMLPASEESRSFIITSQGVIFLQNSFVAYVQL
ncbi:hypothetical protein QNI16_04230 [Cytophagaceae bacterium YF14B1]|uniref:Lipoprotein n=1 Tax=Xanthocytophaga flava TaxID=3048013 RepID=A0AAE3QMA7_9BACT|nr:hypothetical protein [Xanthocytophaga flavus]MDJ1479680.1 hypothetical protein [Xanthocytophaga flavus]